jgi:hypothetical protein
VKSDAAALTDVRPMRRPSENTPHPARPATLTEIRPEQVIPMGDDFRDF